MEPVIFRPTDRPDIEILVDGIWLSGELRGWVPHDGDWTARVKYSLRPGHMSLANKLPEQIRGLEDDDSDLQPPG